MSNKTLHTGRKYILLSLPDFPFDYNYLMWRLRSYRSPRDKISRMIKNSEIIQIKKGLYLRSPDYGGRADRKIMANLIYGPSYISLDSALQYWGLIPERVEAVTSISNKRNKFYHTPFGIFSYRYLHPSKYYPGVLLEKSETSGQRDFHNSQTAFLIASKEKTLCDKLANVKEIRNLKDVPDYLEKDLRADTEDLQLDIPLLEHIEKVYKKKSVTAFVRWYKDNAVSLKLPSPEAGGGYKEEKC